MRITPNKPSLTLVSFLSVFFCYAAPSPDLPVPQDVTPPGETVPIDSAIVILVFLAIIYAVYIFKFKLQTK